MNHDEQSKRLSQLIAKCWANEDFKRKLLADPTTVLKEEGLEIPANMDVCAVENTDELLHVVIPAMPSELSDDNLENAAGGTADACDLCSVRHCVLLTIAKG